MSSNLKEFVLGGLAGSGACLFTNPLEVVKTRMQLQGELKARGSYAVYYRNVFHASYTIARHEGILALQKGLAPGICYQVIMNGARLGSYQVFTNTGLTLGQDGQPVFLKCLVAGAISGALGAFLGSPVYMMKTQLQSQSAQQIAVGHQHSHKGFIAPLKSTYSTFGITGLWRGVSSAMARVMVGSAAQLSTFSKAKGYIENTHIFAEKSWLVPACGSMISSVAVVMCMTPFDVVATRLYNQGTDRTGKGLVYRGFLDCFWKVFKKEGVLGFYKGVGPHYFRIGPHTILSLLFWDELRMAYAYYFGKSDEK
ncbi:solute carrier family 25 member 35 [Exaiptasia diaphana]|uniref:Solute carrier family 25 member 35 n=1 Tax=Exaiptasia diaphana TaxID=2652724 RepID=A0A913XER3_EXADI|nr:solute carrier family 25 member 35 [Exaiptasia diaphana]XP_020903329.1 solute carrier family 25 member 35 [Exaiptasia diaphana]KXJ12691.1 Solute carrier family 25 member 35 [Exaiptasia diaphana]